MVNLSNKDLNMQVFALLHIAIAQARAAHKKSTEVVEIPQAIQENSSIMNFFISFFEEKGYIIQNIKHTGLKIIF